jgi:hypothetical protein
MRLYRPPSSSQALYIYGNNYEGGGFLFYTMTTILFYILYGMILLMIGYLSVFADGVAAGILSIMLFVTLFVQLSINRIFVKPSRSLSLVKAVSSDKKISPESSNVRRKRKYEQYLRAKREWEALLQCSKEEEEDAKIKDKSGGTISATTDTTAETTAASNNDADRSAQEVRDAVSKLEGRYRISPTSGEDDFDTFSDLTGSEWTDSSGPAQDFFVYRQPSLNRATWESRPRPYRKDMAKRRFDGSGNNSLERIGVDFWDL